MQLNVAIVGPAHGLKGEVKLDVRTDNPQRRLAVGAVLATEPASAGPLTVERTRVYKGVTYAKFVEVNSREAAEAIRAAKLVIESEEDEGEENAWFPHQLKGLEALDPEGYELGIVIDVESHPAQDLLIVREPDGVIARVPFVSQIVTEVDLDDHCVIIDAPPGLFSEEELVVVENEGENQE
ncbi:16S rRNA processing protein RimM [Arcanobacterium wilhelmae]|uniref:Ribosome maturation factor RimM n=1 Tax=Arcanobacterium wilhelmae TaxID=1803177 RepID=A0ABT9N9E7_9ACTO|nr:ribosome maturation factor RimM [Arcanobacterium wilhelmae]MDP9800332.1 16S rRNA processing protein RimM [Arcanobacterium wilhelmae]